MNTQSVEYSEGLLRKIGVYLTHNRLIDFVAYYPHGLFAREVRGKNSQLWIDRVRFELGEDPVQVYPPGGYRYYNLATTNRKPWGTLGLVGRHTGQVIQSTWKCQDMVNDGQSHFILTELGIFWYLANVDAPLDPREGRLEHLTAIKERVTTIQKVNGYVWALTSLGELYGCRANIGQTFVKLENIPPLRYIKAHKGRQEQFLLYTITLRGDHRIIDYTQLLPHRLVPFTSNNSISRFYPKHDSEYDTPFLALNYFASVPPGMMVHIPGESSFPLSRPGMKPNEVYLLPDPKFVEFYETVHKILVLDATPQCLFSADGRVYEKKIVDTFSSEADKFRRSHPDHLRAPYTVLPVEMPGEYSKARVTSLGCYLHGKTHPGMNLAVIWR